MNIHTPTPTPPLSIREATKRFGITSRALRFYEEQGMVVPVHPDGAQRSYSADQVVLLALIVDWRRLGFSIREIKHHLAQPAAARPAHAAYMYSRRRDAARAAVLRDSAVIRDLTARIGDDA